MATVGLSLGSNLGDRVPNLQEAVKRLSKLAIDQVRCASLYETVPVDCPPESGYFLNTVVEIQTDLAPEKLLLATQTIESELGRPSEREQNAPRPIDIDLLYYDDLELSIEELVLPHPRMREREFVLRPLFEIRKDLVSERELNKVENSDFPVELFCSDWI